MRVRIPPWALYFFFFFDTFGLGGVFNIRLSVSLNSLSCLSSCLFLESDAMCPQPLSRFKNKDFEVNLDALKERPELSAKIMRVINIWSIIDTLYPRLLCNFLESDLITTVALYNSVINSALRVQMLSSAANKALADDQEGLELFNKTQEALESPKSRRNEFAHHIWCLAPEIDGGICLIKPNDIINMDTSFEQIISRRISEVTRVDMVSVELINKKDVMVYRDNDLKSEVERALKSHELMRLLLLCFHRTGNLVRKTRKKSRAQLTEALKF
ncbi:MAG: hypothetical protein IIB73_07490 [Proteobacteria bacterium]|nr:hypothetical protein [Pseudomonadota bacterium]